MEHSAFLTNEYFTNLIKQITDQSNKVNSKTKIIEQKTVNNVKDELISTLNEIQIPDLNKKTTKNVFFVPNENLKFKSNSTCNKIGKLVILDDFVKPLILENLM